MAPNESVLSHWWLFWHCENGLPFRASVSLSNTIPVLVPSGAFQWQLHRAQPKSGEPLTSPCALFLIQASDESFQKPDLPVHCYTLSCPERLSRRSKANVKPAWATWQDALFNSGSGSLPPPLSRGWTGFSGLTGLCFLAEPARPPSPFLDPFVFLRQASQTGTMYQNVTLNSYLASTC